MDLRFDRSLEAVPGVPVPLSALVTRLLAPNPGPFTFRGTGVYIVGAGASVAVIDPGPAIPEHLEALKRALGRRRVSHILVTHTHADHAPAAAPLKEWSGAKTYAFPLRPAMRSARGGGGAAFAEEGVVDEAADPAFVPDIAVTDGMRIDGEGFVLEGVHTPGHTSGHMCFALAREQALFSGDHVMGWSTSVIAPPDGDMAAYLASLDKLIARDDRILYPTHGSPIAQPRAYLRALKAHRLMRGAQIARAVASGDATVAALVARLYPGLQAALLPAAAQMVRAHLAHLLAQGAVARDGEGYTAPRQ